jgi:nitrous oxidase accessory protein
VTALLALALVAAGADVQAALDAAAPGETVELAPGRHAGPVKLGKAVALVGPATAVLRGGVTLAAPGARLAGITVDAAGARVEREDAAVHVTADGVVVEGVTIDEAAFGIVVERARHVTVRNNRVRGAGGVLGLRGDGIHLWETRDSLVAGNLVTGARDVVVWYSSGNRIVDNTISGGRYGSHLMYSHDCLVAGNRFEDDVVGVFVMYSHGVTISGNTVARAGGAAGMGLGLKDSGNLRVDDNLLVGDTVGIYVDDSPLQLGEIDTFTGNRIAGCDAGMTFLSGTHRTLLRHNAFSGNGRAVRVEGGGDALGVRWEENYFDDYAGYDLDGDGVGDVPYELASLSGQLLDAHPELGFFQGTAALALVDAVGALAPLYPPRVILVDPRPRMEATSAR